MSMERCCPPTRVVRRDFEPPATLLKAVADPYRLAIIATLGSTTNAVCVCDFTDGLPLNQPTVSHHLRTLREAGLVTSERLGTWVYYRLAPNAHRRLRDALDAVLPKKAAA
jgi:DNA-binding transcriptional ArsR family regulator